jgi:hypothetical protein
MLEMNAMNVIFILPFSKLTVKCPIEYHNDVERLKQEKEEEDQG